MIPVVFAGCAGWLYSPPAGTAVRRGIVLCDGFGYEALCTQRAMAALATMLAEAGLPTLRFHYPGTGDSVGDEEPGQIDRWIASIGTAVDYLRQATGGAEIALCGFRLGATLALEAARQRGDIAALGLLVPVPSGRHYVRELLLAAALKDAVTEADWLEVQGYPLHRTDLARLRELDPQSGADAARQVLLLAPVQPAATSGCNIEIGIFPELTGLMQEAEDIVYPVTAFKTMAAWLCRGAAPSVAPTLLLGGESALRLDGGILEHAVCFGPGGGRFGVLCKPAVARPGPGVLILNTGLNHHIGNGRGGVRLARRLAAAGVVSLRIDADGIGESRPIDLVERPSFYDLGRVRDVRAALDVLQGAGCGRVVIVGICAGAYIGLHAACTDSRVTGLVLTNLPYFYVEEEDPTAALWRRWLHPRYWSPLGRAAGQPARRGSRWVERLVTRLLGLAPAVAPLGALRCLHFFRVWLLQRVFLPMRRLMPRERPVGLADRMFYRLRRRGISPLLAYSPRDPGVFELVATFGRGGKRLVRQGWGRVTVFAEGDHVMMTATMQEAYASLIEGELGLETGTMRSPGEIALTARIARVG